mmetsp:Transcript_760/g.1920  ORF Transcript_760/g.1920 Transcript_760/m.1920 type:complete len:456 (-) Transcript_760:109-1476(-)
MVVSAIAAHNMSEASGCGGSGNAGPTCGGRRVAIPSSASNASKSEGSLSIDYLQRQLHKAGQRAPMFLPLLRKWAIQAREVWGGRLTPENVEEAVRRFQAEGGMCVAPGVEAQCVASLNTKGCSMQAAAAAAGSAARAESAAPSGNTSTEVPETKDEKEEPVRDENEEHSEDDHEDDVELTGDVLNARDSSEVESQEEAESESDTDDDSDTQNEQFSDNGDEQKDVRMAAEVGGEFASAPLHSSMTRKKTAQHDDSHSPEERQAKALWMQLRQKHAELKDWEFCFDHAKRRHGCCKYNRKQISMSRHFINNVSTTVDQVKNTILHEIAHALVGHKHGHDAVWRKMALQLGCDGSRCSKTDWKMEHHFELRCKKCSWTRGKHRRSSLVGKRCPKCKSDLEYRFNGRPCAAPKAKKAKFEYRCKKGCWTVPRQRRVKTQGKRCKLCNALVECRARKR